MDRLTMDTTGKTGIGLTFDLDVSCANMDTAERLQDLIVRLGELEKAVSDSNGKYELDRLRALAEADRDGRVVVMPCKPGDTVYKLGYQPCHNGEDHPDEMACCGCEDECDLKRAVVPCVAGSIERIVRMMESIGKYWFLTRAEAEAKLAGEEQK